MRKRVSRDLYGNCEVYPPDSDRLMFRTTRERLNWYIGRGLAILIRDDPPAIRLAFQPGGPGHGDDPYFLQRFLNQCVVCGTSEGLSHHHVVPNAYRKRFPRESYGKGRWMYDVLLLCIPCHDRYERFAHELKEEIAAEYGIPSSGITNLDRVRLRAMKGAAALYRHGDKIPPERKGPLLDDVRTYLGKSDPTMEDLWEVWNSIRDSIDTIPAGRIVAKTLEIEGRIDDFAVRWRRHFVSRMKPQYLPKGWDPERRIYSEPDQTQNG